MALLGLAAQPSLGLESWGGTVGSSSLVEPAGTLGLRQEAEVFGKGQSPSENFRTFRKIQESVPKLRNLVAPARPPPDPVKTFRRPMENFGTFRFLRVWHGLTNLT